MKALIVDDERLARDELRLLLSECHPEVEVVGEAANVREAISQVARLQPEVIFLDIQMPGRSGFELLEALEQPPRVIFVTAYDEHALRAFDFGATDYLLKPIEPARLARALARLDPTDPVQESNSHDPPPSPHARRLTDADHVFVKDGEKCFFIRVDEIRLVESEGKYSRLHFDGHRALVARSVSALEARLDAHTFFRASRQHLFNLRCVERVEPWFSGGLLVHLAGGHKVEMSRRQAQAFRDLTQL